jgi:hypothetical protein
MRLNLEWQILAADHAALIFGKPPQTVFQSTAALWGIDPSDMTTAAIAKLRGPIMARCAQD